MSKNISEIKGKKLNHRRYFGRGPRPDMNEFKKEEAQKRMEIWQRLSPKEQLEILDRRLGVGEGAKKQRARLAILLETRNKKQEEKIDDEKPRRQKEPRKTFDKKSQRRAKKSSDT